MQAEKLMRGIFVAILALLLSFVLTVSPSRSQDEAKPLTKEELEQLLAPIALYPDALLAQVLMASTYPLEVVTAARWVKANPKVTGKALEDALQKQSWDPSVKSLVAIQQALQMMNDRLDWTQQLGDAFLAQKEDVMAAIQSLRARAKAAGKLDSTKEMNVSTTTSTAPPPPGATAPPEVIVIEPTQPEVIYVPSYDPAIVYGGWPYPAYPPMTWYPPGYVAGRLFWFGAGVAVGAALWGGFNWGRGDVNINVNRYNSFNRTNINNVNWNHNELHRKGVPYRDNKVAERYNKGGRTDAAARERFRGRQEASRPGGVDRPGARPGGVDRPAARPGGVDRPGARPGGVDRPAARPGGVDRPGASRPQMAHRPTGMDHPRATNNIGKGQAARAHSARGASSRAASPASHAGAAHTGGAARGGRR